MLGFLKLLVNTAVLLAAVQTCFAQDSALNLSFNNADIDSVVSAISRAINKSIIVDPKVKGSISLNSKQALTPNEIIDNLATALRLNGFALVDTPNGYRVVTEADAKLQSSQTFTSKNNVVGDQIITRVIKLNFESAPNVVALIRPLVSPNNTINALPGNNSILITDYASNISRIEKIIQSVDSPTNTKVETIALKNAQATEVAGLINKVLESSGPQGGDGLSKLMVVADPRANVLLVKGGNAERVAQIQSLVAKLDVSKSAGNIWVIPLRNAEASKLAITLRALVAADNSFTNPASAGAQVFANPSASNQGVPPPMNFASNVNQMGGGASAAATSALTSSSGPSTGGSIQADPITNSLIITASEPVYKNLLRVVEQLDRRRAQIYIESMIVELTDSNAAELGVQWQALIGSNQGFAGTNFNGPNSSGNTNIFGSSASINNAVNNTNTGPNALLSPLGLGLNIGSLTQFGPNLAFSSLLRTLQSINGTNVLSTPNLMTLDNEEARIIVGQNIPILTGSYSQTASTATVTPFQTYTRQDVGITLRVRPQSSENGTVKLQIFQEVSSVQDYTNAGGVILNKRNIESNVVVDDGQIIVLGGLIADGYTDGSQKIPVLGDIPLIGGIFRYDNKSRTKTNLMVFIRPRVLRDSEQNIDLSNTKLDELNKKREQFVPVPMLMKQEKLNDQTLKQTLE
jgi:general secretion pathway protein D